MTTTAMSLRTLLRTPPALRPFLIQQQQQAASYHSYEHPAPPVYPEPANSILSSALQHVPQQGFTRDALVSGAKDNNYLDISAHNLFPNGPFDLVKYYLVTQRLALADRVQFPPPDASGRELGTGQKIKSLILARLRANIDTGILPHLPQALGQMSLAENILPSLRELGLLADEMWFLAGDKSVDSSWYTKRATLSAVYASTEVFQTRDQSTDHKDTEEFLGRRLEEVRVLGSVVGGTAEWVGFQAGAMVNLLRSKGVRV